MGDCNIGKEGKPLRFIFVGILTLGVLMTGIVVKADTPSTAVYQAQQRLWDYQDQLADAHYHLSLLRFNEESNHLQAALPKARSPQKVAEIQVKLNEVDRKRWVEQKRLLLNHQLVNAERSSNRAAVDSIRFQLKDLR
jgi:hypothetical protein